MLEPSRSFTGFIEEITSRTKTGGVTVDFKRKHILEPSNCDFWLFPMLPDYTEIIPNDESLEAKIVLFIQRHLQILQSPGVYFGAWINPSSLQIYLDVCTVEVKESDALERVRNINAKSTRKIEALYHPKQDKTITL